jgi:hypothetical protein
MAEADLGHSAADGSRLAEANTSDKRFVKAKSDDHLIEQRATKSINMVDILIE